MRRAAIIPVMKISEGLTDSRGIIHWFVATAIVLLTTLALDLAGATSTTAGMVFLVLVVWSATQAGVALSVYMALLCALSFDYSFLPPYHTLMLAGIQQWVAMFSFAGSCLVVSRVAETARRQTFQAQQRRLDMERLYELSQEMMLYDNAEHLIRELPRIINQVFSLNGVVLYVFAKDEFHASTSDLPMSIRDSMRAVAQTSDPTLEIPGEFSAMALMLGLRPVGAMAWRPNGLAREVVTAVSAQVGIVIARSLAVETSARSEAAREGERLRTALTDSLTHELRTPLTSIRAAATTLLEAGAIDDESRRDLVSIIDEEASRLDLLIGDAVEMAEIDANAVDVRLAPQHPRAFLDQAVEESRKTLAAHRIAIAAQPAEEPDEPVWFDPHLLGRVMRHLLENVAKYTPPGSLVTLSFRRSDNRLLFTVDDNGPGIEEFDLPLIFEKFYRGKAAKSHGKGSGMGLAITRSILAAHGGGIEASSVAGKGATFSFWVPLVENDPWEKG